MPAITKSTLSKYQPGCKKDLFLKDKANYQGHIYAIKKNDTVFIEKIFASVKSVFEFLYNLVFNSKNTFVNTNKINQTINNLTPIKSRTSIVSNSSFNAEEDLSDIPLEPFKSIETYKEKYYEFMDLSFPYLDGWLENLKDLSTHELDLDMQQYLEGELIAINNMIARKEKEALRFHNCDIECIRDEAKNTINDALKTIKKELADFKLKFSPQMASVPGIKNAGNSCYMNSALQGLLASPVIRDRIKKYDKDPLPKHESYMPTLKSFLAAYENHSEKPNAESSNLIAKCASQLRAEFYHTRLKHFDVDGEHDMADADLIVMLLGEALNIEYTLITRQSAQGGNSVNGTYHQAEIVTDVNSTQLIWPEIKTTGEPSLQEAFNQQCILDSELHDLDWRTHSADGTAITVDDAKRSFRLKGEAPPLLVFKVGKSIGEDMDSSFESYCVGQKDEFLDAAQAFDSPPEGGAKYKLISVMRNHSRLHWTAMTRRENGWYNCNDSSVDYLGKKTPDTTAAVMVYELIK